MPNFDPARYMPIPPQLSVMPTHGESWSKKRANWWAGATIASPTMDMVAPAAHALHVVRRLVNDPPALNEYYAQETEDVRAWVRRVLDLETSVPVILDASGTAAILTASRILSYVPAVRDGSFWTLTTSEGGSLVPATLKGKNPNELEKVMFQPVTSLFYEAEPVLQYPFGIQPSMRIVAVAGKTNQQLVDEIKEAVENNPGPGLIVLPHVTKTGRVLPIREIGHYIASLRAQGRQVFYIVDDIQGIGRMPTEAVSKPLTFCDAYLFGSSKALGGILIASAVVMKESLLEAFCQRLADGVTATAGPSFSHFQFGPDWEKRLPESLMKGGAVSLPECVSMRAGLYQLFIRGQGDTFLLRRQNQLARIKTLRQKVVDALKSVRGLQILEATADKPLVPSIVCFNIDKERWTPGACKRALQAGDPIVTPSAPIDRLLRLDIPEYRPLPSLDVLVKKLNSTIS